ncbi:O-antigen ligase family protein [Cyanobium sp. Aljojuca 7D2]|uniref:O-antigen ligase family protein n=1 Tax=Cyanobium sp. Aljojuca 7D2 TaxID=2823698 RepID=UPI0020CFE1F7|nr:O-antigen ligase family protein [Cyanobium sp. Aljojuca 7D2]
MSSKSLSSKEPSGNRLIRGSLSQIKAIQSYLGPLGGASSPALDALLFLGLIGIYYPGWGRVMAWMACAAALLRYSELSINTVLVRNVGILLACLLFASALSANRLLSASAVVDIALGFCMFLPGMLFGRQLLVRPFQAVPLLLACLFAVIHLAFPVSYLGRISYGFFDNPNINGRGLTYAAILLGILICSFARFPLQSRISRLQRFLRISLFAISFGGVASLLIVTNYRAGWLAIGSFLLVSYLVLGRAMLAQKIIFASALCGAVTGLVLFVDVKGFGYGSVGERVLMWTCSAESWIKSYFWFGAGFDSFKSLQLSCLPESALGLHSFPHNVLIELLLSGGIVGSVCVFIFVVVQFSALRREGCLKSPVAVAALCAILGLLVSSQFGMKFASFTYVGSISALFGIAYSQRLASKAVGAQDSVVRC